MQVISVCWFCILKLLNSLISFSNFLILSLRFSIYSIMSSANSESFTYFLIWIPFISFLSLIALPRTFHTRLKNSCESGHPCLVPDLRGNVFSFSPLRMMFAIGLSYMAFIMLKSVPSISIFLKSFNHKWVQKFVKGVFCFYWDYHMGFIFQFVNIVHHILHHDCYFSEKYMNLVAISD